MIAAVTRVISLGALPPEKLAFALARYSRSPDSIVESLAWVKAHDSARFLESFYFNYGHASIADLGHLALCFEGVSERAAIEIEDEPLWDGQARSSRYQDFGRSGFITPPELDEAASACYAKAAARLLAAYREVHARIVEHLSARLPRPEEMTPGAYGRVIAARAFDVARYLLPLGIPTGIGQVTSIRTLERQIRRWKASPLAELRELGEEATTACTAPPTCAWCPESAAEPVAPTLARYLDADPYPSRARAELAEWARQNLGSAPERTAQPVELTRPTDTLAQIAATLLYAVTDWPFADLYGTVHTWSRAQRAEVLDVAVRSRGTRDELLREFRGAPLAFDLLIDIGAYRDLHRHRRCHQTRQAFSWQHGFSTPVAVSEAGMENVYISALEEARLMAVALGAPASEYLLPFAARGRFLFQMDFAEADYLIRLRSGVKGHFSYRTVAWQMKQELDRVEPELGRLVEATPPWVEDPLTR
jgi:thymidylate synthase ThyX